MTTPYGRAPGDPGPPSWPYQASPVPSNHQGHPDHQHPTVHGGQPAYPPPFPTGDHRPPPPRRRRRWPWIAAAAVVVVLAALVGTGLGSGPATSTSAAGSGPATTSARAPVTTPAPPRLAVPDVQGMTGESAVAALRAAGFSNVIVEQNGAPASAPVISQNPVAGHRQDADDPIRLRAQPPPPVPHREVSARDWQLIAKSPDSHIGERIVLHGHVTQFDAATGLDAFRASVDAVRHSRSYEYDTNTILRGTATQLADVVNGDMFRAEVTVRGSYSYETTMGGMLTVPVLGIDAIEVTG
jgi:hypothetical protein